VRILSSILVLFVGMMVTAFQSSLGSDQQKIGVVDMASLIKAHPETKAADAVLQKQVDDFEAEQKDMLSEIEKLKKSFDIARKEADSKALSESEKEKKLAAAEDKLNDLRDLDKKFRETMGERQKQISDQEIRMKRRIVGKIRDVVKEYAGKEKYSLVLDASALSVGGVENVLYSAEKNDITADIRKLIEEQKKDTSGK
jgi:Skp family chaperone for outer membrane proteins